MKIFLRYILSFLFLAGFSFTGKNKGPLLHSSGGRMEHTVQQGYTTSVQAGQEQQYFDQLFCIDDSDNDEDTYRLCHHLPYLLYNNLSDYYLSRLESQDILPANYTRFVHADTPVPAVPKFISYHQLLIPFNA